MLHPQQISQLSILTLDFCGLYEGSAWLSHETHRNQGLGWLDWEMFCDFCYEFNIFHKWERGHLDWITCPKDIDAENSLQLKTIVDVALLHGVQQIKWTVENLSMNLSVLMYYWIKGKGTLTIFFYYHS